MENLEKKVDILERVLGGYEHKSSSKEFLFYCPNCDHHKRKFSINIEKNVFKCWICEFHGKSIAYLIYKFGKRYDITEWKKYDIKVSEIVDFEDYFKKVEVEDENKIFELPKEFRTLIGNKILFNSLVSRKYLKDRGLTKQDIIDWKIGYAVEGQYSGRIIVPSVDINGNINFYIARTYVDSNIKYLNPQNNKNIVFNDLYLDWDKDIVIVEGIFDAIKSGRNSIPLLGSTLSSKGLLFNKILDCKGNIYLALDSDAKKKETKIVSLLMKYGICPYIIDVSPFKDVGEMSHKQFLIKKEKAKKVERDHVLLQMLEGI
ncbi:CHC2 zinc finger domain-containing protein [Candidatus Pacearchaeota archaeon]|nr:CHC2 zinc finger domain-containing protein [Candidatus Pacearchaeota archaeon]